MLDHLDDIASDLSVFHRITDASVMSARAFAALVQRLPAYGGAVAAAAARESEDDSPEAPPGFERVQFEGGGGESFESRMARAQAVPAGAAGEATITRLMTAGA